MFNPHVKLTENKDVFIREEKVTKVSKSWFLFSNYKSFRLNFHRPLESSLRSFPWGEKRGLFFPNSGL